MMFSPMTKINSSLEATVQYMAGAFSFIESTVRKATTSSIQICPFQLDMAFAVGEPKEVMFGLHNANAEDPDTDYDTEDENSDDEKNNFDDEYR